MFGAIAGDIIGSIYEAGPIKHKSFQLFHPACTYTDDSVLTVAVANAILENRPYRDEVLRLGRRFPYAGYGGSFRQWLRAEDPAPYGSWGNGAAMRVSPISFAFDTVEEVLDHAKESATITHDHPEGVKGAQAAALVGFLARTGASRENIRQEISERFDYDLNRTVDTIRPAYSFDVSCQRTVPEAIVSFLDSESYEDAVRNAVSLGGDSDTLACIAGGIAEAFYGGVPENVFECAKTILDDELLDIAESFCVRYRCSGYGECN